MTNESFGFALEFRKWIFFIFLFFLIENLPWSEKWMGSQDCAINYYQYAEDVGNPPDMLAWFALHTVSHVFTIEQFLLYLYIDIVAWFRCVSFFVFVLEISHFETLSSTKHHNIELAQKGPPLLFWLFFFLLNQFFALNSKIAQFQICDPTTLAIKWTSIGSLCGFDAFIRNEY